MLAYTSQPYSEAMVMRPEVTYTPCATSSREQIGDIITFAHCEEGDILTKTCNDAESRFDILTLRFLSDVSTDR